MVDREAVEVIYHNASWGGCSHTKPQPTCDAEAVSHSYGHMIDENRFCLWGQSPTLSLSSTSDLILNISGVWTQNRKSPEV